MTLASALTRLWAEIERRRACARAARDLHAMPDHLLADLGIERDQIEAYVHGRVCRATTLETRPNPRAARPASRGAALRPIQLG